MRTSPTPPFVPSSFLDMCRFLKVLLMTVWVVVIVGASIVLPIWIVQRELRGLPRLHPGLCKLETVQPDKYVILFTANETNGENFTYTAKTKKGLAFRDYEDGEVVSCYGRIHWSRECSCRKDLIQFDSDKDPVNVVLVVFLLFFNLFSLFIFISWALCGIRTLLNGNREHARNRPQQNGEQTVQNPNLHEKRVVLYDGWNFSVNLLTTPYFGSTCLTFG